MESLSKRSFLVFSIILILALNLFCFLHFMPLVQASTSVTFSINDSSNDCSVYETGTGHPPWDTITLVDTVVTFGYDVESPGYYYGAGLRFAVTIPEGATINDANLSFYSSATWLETTVNLRIAGEDIDNSSVFSTVSDYNGRSRTSYVSWSNVGGWADSTWKYSPNITSIVQTIVSREGWGSPSYMSFFVEDVGTSTAFREGHTFDSGSYFPRLQVTYTEANTPEYDYVDSQTNVDSSADKGTHSSFTAQKATDWTNDTLIEANTNTTALNNSENFVDANTSNIDSHTGHGTSSNFTAQQDSNVLYNDTLTEANTGGATTDVFTDGFEDGTFNKWDGNGATTWTNDGGICINGTNLEGWVSSSHSGTYYAGTGASGDGNLVSDNIDLSGVTSFGVQFWYAVDDTDGAGELVLKYWDGAAYDTIADLSGNTEDTWTRYSAIITDNQYFDSTFRIDFLAACGTGEAVYIDDVVINKTMPANYELDYEFSWTTADYDEANEYLCIRTNSFTGTAENLGVDVWDGSWKSISNSLTASSWNNISISSNLSSGTIYFRCIGKTESSDTAQNTWIIECSLIHTWSVGVNYELDLEEQFTSANFSRTSVELCVRMGAYNTTEDVRLDYWNASASAWIVAIATLTTDVWNNVSVKAYTSDASVTFTVRFVGVTESGDTERSMWDKDACLLHTWDTTGPAVSAFTLGLSILIPVYNALTKELGFQSSSLILPSSMGYFWKSLPFQVTGAINFFESTNIYRALAFLATGIVNFFSSLLKAMELNFQPSVSIVPSSTNYFSKAIGFQTANTVQSFSSVTMQKALGFLTSGTSNLFTSLSKTVALSFQPGNSILPSATSYLSKALGFQTSEVLMLSSANSFWKALGFQASDMIRVFDSASMLKGLGFLSTGLSNIFDFSALSKEVGFQVSEFQRAENIFPSATSYFWKALGFQPTNPISVYDFLGIEKGLGFLTSGTVNGFSSVLKGMSLAFQSSGTFRLWDSSVTLRGLGFELSATARLFGSTSMLKGLGYLATNTINIFDSSSILKGLGFQATNTIIPSSTGYFWKAIGLQPTATIKVYDSSVMQKAIGFLTTGTINVYSTILRGIELRFTPSGILYPFAYGSSGKETATILVDRFELARLFDNAEMLKALGFRTTGSLNLFGSSAMSKAIGLLTSGTINFYDASTLLKAKGFLASGNINLFSTVLRGVEIAFQSFGTVKLWDSTSMLKAIGFQSSDSIRLFDGNLFGKGLLFQPSQTINVFAGFQVAKEQLFTILNVFNYENLNPLASLSQTKAIQFSVLGEITRLFSSLSSNLGREFFNYDLMKMFSSGSFNMAKGFNNYDVVHPSGFLLQNKAIGFNVDGLVRLLSDMSIGVEKAFGNFGTINPFSFLMMNKALDFKTYELPLFFDYLGMNKAIRITVFEFFNTEPIRLSSMLTMNKAVLITFTQSLFGTLNIQSLMIPIGQIVIVPGVPISNFWKILALFSIVMLMASGVFLIEKQRKIKQSQSLESQ